MPIKNPVTVDLPSAEESPTVDVVTAGHALGIRASTAYRLAQTGQLTEEVPVLRIGQRYKVPTAALRAALQLDQ